MNFRRSHFIGLCLFLFLLGPAASFCQDTLAYWGFSEGTGSVTQESVSKASFNIQSKWPVVEWVPGVQSSAMRTDGYSVWASGSLPQELPTDRLAISGWIALEVYPLSHAAIWAQFDESSQTGLWIGTDQFGRLDAEFYGNSLLHSFTSSISLPHYQWNYIVVNLDASLGKIEGYLNGVKVIDQSFTAAALVWPISRSTWIGKYPKQEMNGLYNSNTMNAIIDQIAIYHAPLDSATITANYLLNLPASGPDMATPFSRFAADFHRPKYHAIPASNWCNESHGLFYANGQYHLFYQKNGNAGLIAEQNWGHLVSANLRQWNELRPALWPEPGWDNYGIWSGHSVFDQTNNPVIVYTGVDGVKAGIGEASPATTDCQFWNKNKRNPLIPHAPASVPNQDFRDPYVFKEAGTWYLIAGSGLQSPAVGAAFLYSSADLSNWQYEGVLYQGNPAAFNSGVFWEMPIFRKFGNRYMLMVNKTPQANSPARDIYWVGDFSKSSFVPGNAQGMNLELINWLLSPSINTDDAGRLFAIGIIPDLLPSSEQYKNGWENVFSLPRLWRMQNDTLYQSPHPYLDADRGDSVIISNIKIQPGASDYVKLRGFQAELRATLMAGSATKIGFILEKNDDGTEATRIYYDVLSHSVVFDPSKSSLNNKVPNQILAGTIPLAAAQPIDWHIYIDGSVIEVFINDKWAFAGRIYPVKSNSNIIDLFAEGGTGSSQKIQIWNRGDLVPYTPVASVVQMNAPFKIWPVPASAILNVQLPANASGNCTIQIHDTGGRLVRSQSQTIDSATSQITMNLTTDNGSFLTKGSYIFNMEIENKKYCEQFLVFP